MDHSELTERDFRSSILRAGVTGDCYAQVSDWPAIRAKMAALFVENPAFRQRFSDPGMHPKGVGYVLAFGKWPFFGMVPSSCGPDYTRLRNAPQVLMTRPRTVEENAFVYRLMEDCRLVLQMSGATGNRNVFPRSVSVKHVLAERLAVGATGVSHQSIAADAVHMKDGADLFRFLRSVNGGSAE